jgi:hypothetical protein
MRSLGVYNNLTTYDIVPRALLLAYSTILTAFFSSRSGDLHTKSKFLRRFGTCDVMSGMIISWAIFSRQLTRPNRTKDANHGPTRPKNPTPHAHWILNLLMLSIHIAPIYLNIRISPLHRLGNRRHEC